MSTFNPAARTETIEVKLNDEEVGLLNLLRGGLGKSPFFRNLLHREANSNGKPPSSPKESRQCRAIRPATRATSVHMAQRRMV
jgi:hypothetical protein